MYCKNTIIEILCRSKHKKKIYRYLGKLKSRICETYAVKSYSQEGEDMILKRIFESHKEGFYVDVGAHHPKRFSNTYYFYKKGWKGINIDATPGSMVAFNKLRKRDINLELPISSGKETLTYYIFNEPALNSFSREISSNRNSAKNNYYIIDELKMETYKLAEVLDAYLPYNQNINFLTIDAEGYDYEVLISNNWDKYKPNVVLIEILNSNLSDLLNHKVTHFLHNKGYEIFAKSYNTVFYKLMNK